MPRYAVIGVTTSSRGKGSRSYIINAQFESEGEARQFVKSRRWGSVSPKIRQYDTKEDLQRKLKSFVTPPKRKVPFRKEREREIQEQQQARQEIQEQQPQQPIKQTVIAYGSPKVDATPEQLEKAKREGLDYYRGGKRFRQPVESSFKEEGKRELSATVQRFIKEKQRQAAIPNFSTVKGDEIRVQQAIEPNVLTREGRTYQVRPGEQLPNYSPDILFTPRRGVTVTAEGYAPRPGFEKVTETIRPTGVGIKLIEKGLKKVEEISPKPISRNIKFARTITLQPYKQTQRFFTEKKTRFGKSTTQVFRDVETAQRQAARRARKQGKPLQSLAVGTVSRGAGFAASGLENPLLTQALIVGGEGVLSVAGRALTGGLAGTSRVIPIIKQPQVISRNLITGVAVGTVAGLEAAQSPKGERLQAGLETSLLFAPAFFVPKITSSTATGTRQAFIGRKTGERVTSDIGPSELVRAQPLEGIRMRFRSVDTGGRFEAIAAREPIYGKPEYIRPKDIERPDLYLGELKYKETTAYTPQPGPETKALERRTTGITQKTTRKQEFVSPKELLGLIEPKGARAGFPSGLTKTRIIREAEAEIRLQGTDFFSNVPAKVKAERTRTYDFIRRITQEKRPQIQQIISDIRYDYPVATIGRREGDLLIAQQIRKTQGGFYIATKTSKATTPKKIEFFEKTDFGKIRIKPEGISRRVLPYQKKTKEVGSGPLRMLLKSPETKPIQKKLKVIQEQKASLSQSAGQQQEAAQTSRQSAMERLSEQLGRKKKKSIYIIEEAEYFRASAKGKIKSILKTAIKSSLAPAFLISVKQAGAQLSGLSQSQRAAQATGQTVFQGVGQATAQGVAQGVRQTTGQLQATGQLQGTRQTTRQTTEQIQRAEQITRQRLFNIRERVRTRKTVQKQKTKKKQRIIIDLFGSGVEKANPTAGIQNAKSYDVQIRRGEKRGSRFYTVAKSLPKNKAIRRLKQALDNYIEASGKLKGSNKKPRVQDSLTQPILTKFRPPKKGSKLPKNTIIEKKGFRLDTRGEVNKISYFRRKKGMKKRGKKKTARKVYL